MGGGDSSKTVQAEDGAGGRLRSGLWGRVVRAITGFAAAAASFAFWFIAGAALYAVLLLTLGLVWPIWVWITAMGWSLWNILEGGASGLVRILMGRGGGRERGGDGMEMSRESHHTPQDDRSVQQPLPSTG